jgi:NTP pyrophosphatase (non-canonical NTP hydrolase)
MSEISELQDEHRDWVQHNFPNQPSYQPLLGIAEEVGELCHAHLKQEQGIRSMLPATSVQLKEDALGDIFIYMMSYANAEGLDLQRCIWRAWHEVSERDWVKYPSTGLPPEERV